MLGLHEQLRNEMGELYARAAMSVTQEEQDACMRKVGKISQELWLTALSRDQIQRMHSMLGHVVAMIICANNPLHK